MSDTSGPLLALIAVLCATFNDAAKKQLADRTSGLVANWFSVTGGVVLGALYFVLTGWPVVDWQVTLAWLPVCAALLIVCDLSFIASIHGNDFSLAMPFKTSNVLFAAILAWLILGETSSVIAVSGMLLVVTGGYLLLWDSKASSWWLPLRRMLAEPASRYMLISNLAYSFLCCFQKMAAPASSPLFFLWGMVLFEFSYFSIAMARTKTSPVAVFRQNPVLCLRIPIFWAIVIGLLFHAMNVSNIAVPTSIMQLQVLLSMFLSHHIFKERDSLARLPAACLMIIGAVLAVFY